MPPGWIKDLHQYWYWLDQQVQQSGGYLAGQGNVEPRATFQSEDPDNDEFTLLDIRDHRLIFYSGHFLKFTITIDSDLDVLFYEYHYAEIAGIRPTIWRACKNGHRADELGSETHVHVGEDTILASAEISFEDAIRAVQDRIPPGLT